MLIRTLPLPQSASELPLKWKEVMLGPDRAPDKAASISPTQRSYGLGYYEAFYKVREILVEL